MFSLDSLLSRRALLASGISTALGARLWAQQETQKPPDQKNPDEKNATFTAGVRVVNVFATVRDRQGKIVRNLTQADFILEENGTPQTIRYFSQESGLPLTLGLLIDTSMSQMRVLGQERTASYRFLSQVLREDKDKAFVIHFDREVELLQDLTSSRKKLEEALTDLKVADRQRPSGGGGGRGPNGGQPGRRGGGGGTALHDSVLLASDELMKKQSGRKALIALTDGVDNGSKVTLGTAIESAQRADTLVYSILFADENAYGSGGGFGRGGGMGRRGGGGGGYPGGRRQDRPDGKEVLHRLSRETGGGFFEVSKKMPIEKIYAQIEEELRNQYSLGYTPEKSETSGYRSIHLATKQQGLIVQTRSGYYADR
jgi:VWFA-related protein